MINIPPHTRCSKQEKVSMIYMRNLFTNLCNLFYKPQSILNSPLPQKIVFQSTLVKALFKH